MMMIFSYYSNNLFIEVYVLEARSIAAVSNLIKYSNLTGVLYYTNRETIENCTRQFFDYFYIYFKKSRQLFFLI